MQQHTFPGFFATDLAWLQDFAGVAAQVLPSSMGATMMEDSLERMPVIRMPEECRGVSLKGQPMVFLVTGPDTKHTSMFDWTIPAGFATGWDELPADLAQAVLLLAAHYYEYRNETALSDGCMPFGVTSLVQRYRPMRIAPGYGT